MSGLSKKIIVNCDICGKAVEVDVSSEELAQQKDGILRIMLAHGDPLHAIVVYIDKNMRVRMIEHPDSFQVDQPRTSTVVEPTALPENLSESRGEPCYQALFTYDQIKEREKLTFILDKTILKVICESGTICLSQIHQKIIHLEKALGERIILSQITSVCNRYIKEGLIKKA